MANQNYKIFPNKVELFKFFGQYNNSINVSASSRLPLNGLAIGKELRAFRSFPEFFSALAELSGLDVDTAGSTIRMGTYIVFFNSEIPKKTEELNREEENEEHAEIHVPESTFPGVEAILQNAAALYDENDKQGSKAKLVDFAATKGVTLKGTNRSFEKLLADFDAALEA